MHATQHALHAVGSRQGQEEEVGGRHVRSRLTFTDICEQLESPDTRLHSKPRVMTVDRNLAFAARVRIRHIEHTAHTEVVVKPPHFPHRKVR